MTYHEQVNDWVRSVMLAEDRAITAAAERAIQLGAGVQVIRTLHGMSITITSAVPAGEIHIHEAWMNG